MVNARIKLAGFGTSKKFKKHWLRTSLYYCKNLPALRTLVNNWAGEGLLVRRAKEAVNVDGLVPDLVRIDQYRTAATNVELLEASDCTMTEVYERKICIFFMNPAQFKLTSKNDYPTLI